MRADVSMNSYVTMPGVVYADEVILQSENIRKLYIRKLTGFLEKKAGICGRTSLTRMVRSI